MTIKNNHSKSIIRALKMVASSPFLYKQVLVLEKRVLVLEKQVLGKKLMTAYLRVVFFFVVFFVVDVFFFVVFFVEEVLLVDEAFVAGL